MIGFRPRRPWRQLTSCILAYAFALQIALFGLAAPKVAALAADQDALSIGLCLHDQGAPPAPAGHSGGDEHCKFCPAVAHTVFAPPAIPHGLVMRVADEAPLPAAARFVPPPIKYATPQPRGPPRTA